MNTTSFSAEFTVSQPPEQVFAAVTRVRDWWSEQIEGDSAAPGDEFVFSDAERETAERRADLVLVVNGLPLVVIEAKTPVRHAVSWLDGALQVLAPHLLREVEEACPR